MFLPEQVWFSREGNANDVFFHSLRLSNWRAPSRTVIKYLMFVFTVYVCCLHGKYFKSAKTTI